MNGVTPLADTDHDGTPDSGPLAPGASYNIVVKATLAATTPAGTYKVSKTASSAIAPGRSVTVDDVVDTVTQLCSIVLEPDNQALIGRGQHVTYPHTLTNRGNCQETVRAMVDYLGDSKAGWTSAAYIDNRTAGGGSIPGVVDPTDVRVLQGWTQVLQPGDALVVPNQLLNKPGRLTPDEFAKVRVHEQVSVQMLSHIDFLRPIAAASDSAHTRFDPDNPDHPIEPYIVMIADAYDAMTSTRAYRKALTQDVAFSELRDKAGIQFHPACVEALIHAVEKRGEKHGAGYEGHAEFDNAPVAGLGSAGLGDLLENEASETSPSS